MAGTDHRKKKAVPFLHRHHLYWFFIAFCGYVFFPPAAILARFGVGKDFFINLLLYICGYIPAVMHNFYCQNIRNNSNRGRSPKWAVKHGLVKDPEIDRSKTRQWTHRYNERAPINPYDDPSYHDPEFDGPPGSPNRSDHVASTNRYVDDRSGRSARHDEPEEEFFNPHESSFGPRPGDQEAEYRSSGKGKKKTRSKRSGSQETAASHVHHTVADHYGSTRPQSTSNDPDGLHHHF